jgi:hypothetical protein
MNAVQPHCKDCTRLLLPKGFWIGAFHVLGRHAAEFDILPR